MAYKHSNSLCRFINLIYIFILLFLLHQCQSLACGSNTNSSTPITSVQVSFAGAGAIEVYAIKRGLVSNSFYYMYKLSSPPSTAIRKINPDESLAWMTVFSFQSVLKSLSVDSNEQHVYFCKVVLPINVIRLQTSNGAIVDAVTL